MEAVCLASNGCTYREQMYLNFYFPISKWSNNRPSNAQIERVRLAVEKALATDEFKQDVGNILDDTGVSVVARTNTYYGY